MLLSPQVSGLISKTLGQILRGEAKEKFPGLWKSTELLVLGLSVFQVSRRCEINLGVEGLAQLCHLLSSSMDDKNLELVLTLFAHPHL